MSGMMGEADAALQAVQAHQKTAQPAQQREQQQQLAATVPLGQSREEIEMEARRIQREREMAEAVKAEHELMKQAIMSSSDPAESEAAARLEQELKHVYEQMEQHREHMRKTDDDAWWVGVTKTGELGNRCGTAALTSW